MAHLVVRKRKYASIEESIRVPGRKTPVKRVIRYFGTRSPDWVRVVRGRGLDGVDWDALERDELQRMKSEEGLAKLMEEAQRTDFKVATGLDLPKGSMDPKPIEKAPSPSLPPAPAVEVEKVSSPSLPDAAAPEAPEAATEAPSERGGAEGSAKS
jgi:hypothetical protein